MSKLKQYAFFLGLLFVAFFIGRGTTPEKQVIKTQTKIEYRDKETITVKVKHPNGTVETTKKTIDKSVINSASKAVSNPIKKDWHISAGMMTDFKDVKPVYTLHVERRVLGDIFVGATLSSNAYVGLTVGLSF